MTDEFLAAFRMISLNPRRKEFELRTAQTVGNALKALITCLDRLGEPSATEEVDRVAKQMLESEFRSTSDLFPDSEPFVLQAEMGLAAKALKTLEFMVDAHSRAAELGVEKVLGWLDTLVTGESSRSSWSTTTPLQASRSRTRRTGRRSWRRCCRCCPSGCTSPSPRAKVGGVGECGWTGWLAGVSAGA